MQKSHTLSGSKLTITSFYDFLGINASTEGPVPRIPKPVPCEVDPKIMPHLMANEFDNLVEKMKKVSSEVVWPHDGNKSEALIKPFESGSNDNTSWHHWQQRSTKELKEYCQLFKSDSLQIPKAIWSDLPEKLKELHVTNVSFNERPNQSILSIIGKCSDVDTAKDIILPAVKELQEKAERDAQTTERKLPLSPLKIKLFTICNLSRELQNVNITILHDTNEILFKGIRAEISEAQVEMYTKFEAIEKRAYESGRNQKIFQFAAKFIDTINDKLESQGTDAVCEVDEAKVTIYGNKKHDLDKTLKVFQDDLISRSMPIEQTNVLAAVQSPKGSKMIDRLNKEKTVIVTLDVEGKELQITGFSGAVDDSLTAISKFLEENVQVEHMVSLPSGHTNFVMGFCSSVFESIQKKYKMVTIQPRPNGLLVTGNESQCTAVISELNELKSSIIQRTHSVDKTGMPELLRQEKGSVQLNRIGKECKCVIEIQKPEGVANKGSDQLSSKEDSETLCYYPTPDGRRLVVHKGDLTKENVDAIVNAANEKLDHIGGLAKAIVVAGMSINELLFNVICKIMRNKSLIFYVHSPIYIPNIPNLTSSFSWNCV